MSMLKNNEQNEKETKKYSLYVHINKINQKKYVGVTSKRPIERWGTNGQKYKGQNYFYNAIQKYGWDNFEHIVIKDGLSKDEAFNLEKEYIKKYSSNDSNYGYNICSGGVGGCGLCGELNPMYGISIKDRMDSETYKKWLFLHQTQEHNELCKKIICLTTMETFDSARIASEKYNIQRSDINACCNNKLYSAGRHPETNEEMIWQFYEDYINGIEKPIKETVSVYCVTTKEVFNGATEAARKYDINPSGITLCCQGKREYCGSFDGVVLQWMYYAEYLSGQPIPELIDKRVICLNSKEVYKDMAEAERKTGILHSNIAQCCNGICSYAGIIDGEKQVWQFYSNYISGNLKIFEPKKHKKVMCQEDGNIFEYSKLANEYYDIKRKNDINECCRGVKKHVYDKNRNKLHFIYV